MLAYKKLQMQLWQALQTHPCIHDAAPSNICVPFTRQQTKRLRQPEQRPLAVSLQQSRQRASPTQPPACVPAGHQGVNIDKPQWRVTHHSAAEHHEKAIHHLRHALRDLRQRPSAKLPDISNSAAQLLPHGWPPNSVRINNRRGTSALLAPLCHCHAVPPVARRANTAICERLAGASTPAMA
jgi:hypothetical protein